MPTESQSNHSSQSDSGVSETTSSGHVRSQSVVSSIFSEAWKRGNQADEPKVTTEELYFKSLIALLLPLLFLHHGVIVMYPNPFEKICCLQYYTVLYSM